jgi:hypothetical protein
MGDRAVTLTEEKVLAYLEEWCRGAAAARPQQTIARHLREAGLAGTTDRDVREAVAGLVLAGKRVGSGPRGCFICESVRDFRVAHRTLYSRELTQRRRRRRFHQSFRDFTAGQGLLPFAAAEAGLEVKP